MRYIIVILLLSSVAGAAVNEWVLGEPTFAQDDEEWVLGGPFVELDNTAAAPAGGQVINVIMTSVPVFLIIGLVTGLVYSNRKAA